MQASSWVPGRWRVCATRNELESWGPVSMLESRSGWDGGPCCPEHRGSHELLLWVVLEAKWENSQERVSAARLSWCVTSWSRNGE